MVKEISEATKGKILKALSKRRDTDLVPFMDEDGTMQIVMVGDLKKRFLPAPGVPVVPPVVAEAQAKRVKKTRPKAPVMKQKKKK